jgi:hypothetical protein
VFAVEGADGPPWFDDAAVLPVVGSRLERGARSFVVLEVDWYGAIRGHAGHAEMALVTLIEVDDTPATLLAEAPIRRRKGRLVVQDLRARGLG